MRQAQTSPALPRHHLLPPVLSHSRPVSPPPLYCIQYTVYRVYNTPSRTLTNLLRNFLILAVLYTIYHIVWSIYCTVDFFNVSYFKEQIYSIYTLHFSLTPQCHSEMLRDILSQLWWHVSPQWFTGQVVWCNSQHL